jgi:TonB family protein
MIAFMLLLTSSSPPYQPQPDPRALFRADDYPPAAAARGEQGTAIARLVVDPTGRVEACAVEISTGSKDLDLTTCEILRHRAKYRPLVGPDGAPLYQVIRTPPITWSIGGPVPTPTVGPDIELTINEAPPNVKLPLDIYIKYVVDPDGAVKSCGLTPVSPVAPQVLVDFACRAAGELPDRIARKADGQAVEAQDASHVRFLLGK